MGRRAKTRIEVLVDALEAAQKAGAALHLLDLRQTSGELRSALREARDSNAQTVAGLERAILVEEPPRRLTH